MTPGRVLALYRVSFAALIIVASVQALAAGHEGAHHHVLALATAEIAGALALLWQPTRIPGAGILLCVFALAQALSALGGAWPTHFLQYAASTALIVGLERALRPQPGGRPGPAAQ